MNEYDSNRILDLVSKVGYSPTSDIDSSNCIIINSCHIREKATDKIYHEVGRLKKRFANKHKPTVIISGCVAQAEGDIMIEKEKFIDAVVGPQSYHKISRIIKNIDEKKKGNYTEFETIEKFDFLKTIKRNNNNKVSAYLTIQEGCNKFCKFCVVPYTRGPEYSRPFKDILSEARNLVNDGIKEITLLGQNVNAYKYNNKKLSDLIYKLNSFKELKRIRYTTSHPKDMSSDLIEVHGKCEKLMPLLHLPVQSGSTKILNMMNRKHDIKNYIEIIKNLKKKKKNIKFSSDFIIGYPYEDEKDFQYTLDLMKEIKFINSYSFLFSPRPGTPSSNLEQVDTNLSRERLKLFQQLSDKIKLEYRKSLLNEKSKVLFENRTKNSNQYFGRDEYNNSVIVSSDQDLTGKIYNVHISELNQNTLFGKIDFSLNNEYFAA